MRCGGSSVGEGPPFSFSGSDLDHTSNVRLTLSCNYMKEGEMMESVVNLQSFEGRFKSGLVFSLVEGLRPGKSLQIIFDHEPLEIQELLAGAALKNITWLASKVGRGEWNLKISKVDPLATGPSGGGCCGVCGGH